MITLPIAIEYVLNKSLHKLAYFNSLSIPVADPRLSWGGFVFLPPKSDDLFSRHTLNAHIHLKLNSYLYYPNLLFHVTLDGSPQQIQPPSYMNCFKKFLCLWGGFVLCPITVRENPLDLPLDTVVFLHANDLRCTTESRKQLVENKNSSLTFHQELARHLQHPLDLHIQRMQSPAGSLLPRRFSVARSNQTLSQSPFPRHLSTSRRCTPCTRC